MGGGGSRGEGGSSHGVLASQSLLGSPWQPHLVLLALLLFNILTLFRAKLNRLYFHFTRICFLCNKPAVTLLQYNYMTYRGLIYINDYMYAYNKFIKMGI